MLSRIFLVFALAVAAAALAPAQAFDSHMPQGVPEVQGAVVQNLSMHYIDVRVGDGEPAAAGKQFTVHYTGWLRDGKKFDSSVDRKEPFHFVQGRRQVISGWDIGFEGMKVGGKRRLFIPYQLGYGELGRGPIPPKAELVFDVELLGVSDPPQTPAAADILLTFAEYEKKVMDLAIAIPDNKYSWRPGPGVRSFAEVFLHIAHGSELMLKLATEGPEGDALKQLIQETQKAEKEPKSKAEILQALADSFQTVRRHLDTVQANALNRETNFFGTKTTQHAVLVSLDGHLGEHLGQAIAYARMNGIVPPWSR